MTSTDAKLVYGFQLPEGFHFKMNPEEIGYDDEFGSNDIGEIWQQIYAARQGILPPKMEWDENVYRNYWDARRLASEKSGIDIEHHCSDKHTMYIVAIAESVTIAWRGFPKIITSLEVKFDWEQKLKDFCSIMKIEYIEPSWLLCSYWG